MKTLVIVESPTKAKTISKFLGRDYHVESSMGHVRDLPKSSMGVDIENGTFLPEYVIPPEKKKKVADLRKLAKESDAILFATDEDREGEAISWHLAEILKINPKNVKRLVFHEITKGAIERALNNPRELNLHLVNAQQARRVLDRLVGYELSPLLWKKVRYGLSAGRVQSVAVHLIVIREKERAKFVSSSYFDLAAKLSKDNAVFEARLVSYDAKPIPSKKDFDDTTGKLKNPGEVCLLQETSAQELASKLIAEKPWTVKDVEETPYQTHPYPPFITSTLQQEASRKFSWPAKHTMRVAQSLYENGYITYMRTDSTHLSDEAVAAAREAAREFGADFVTAAPRQFETKVKSAQEAHEAIRPAGSIFRHPGEIQREVGPDEGKLYDLVWKRTVASQMKSAELIRVGVSVAIEKAVFVAKGKRIVSPGYLRAYVEGADDPEAELEDQEIVLPRLSVNDEVRAEEVLASGHTTEPPARYTEASLIKKLESEGVGRPSTYATILDTIMSREYVVKQGSALLPTFTAMIVDDFLHRYFAPLVDTQFTSRMENDLDRVAVGEEDWQPYLRQFYKENPEFSLHKEVELAENSDEYPVMALGHDPKTNAPVVAKVGKYGPYIQRGEGGEGNTCSLPDSLAPSEVTLDKALELLARPSGPTVLGVDEETGEEITFRNGRYGPYIQRGEDTDKKKAKKVALTYGPKRLPVSRSVNPNAPTFADAKRVLTLPRPLGEIDGVSVVAGVGRFGPYLKKADDFRSLPSDKDLLEVRIEEARAIFAEEKKTRRRKAAEVLKDLGTDPKSKKNFQVLNGRFGPYISNGGRVFVSVPKDEPIENLTLERAIALLEEKKTKKKTNKKSS